MEDLLLPRSAGTRPRRWGGQAEEVLDPEEREEMMNFALDNVEVIHQDGRIEWRPHAVAAAAAAGF